MVSLTIFPRQVALHVVSATEARGWNGGGCLIHSILHTTNPPPPPVIRRARSLSLSLRVVIVRQEVTRGRFKRTLEAHHVGGTGDHQDLADDAGDVGRGDRDGKNCHHHRLNGKGTPGAV